MFYPLSFFQNVLHNYEDGLLLNLIIETSITRLTVISDSCHRTEYATLATLSKAILILVFFGVINCITWDLDNQIFIRYFCLTTQSAFYL